MQSSIDIVQACMQKTGLTKHAIAAALGAQPGQIYKIIAGKLFLTKSMCEHAAGILEVEYAGLYNIACAERETNKVLKESLMRVAQPARTAALILGITAPLAGARGDGNCILC